MLCVCVCENEKAFVKKKTRWKKRTKEDAVIDPFFSHEGHVNGKLSASAGATKGPMLSMAQHSPDSPHTKASAKHHFQYEHLGVFFACGRLYIKDHTCNFLQIYRHIYCILILLL